MNIQKNIRLLSRFNFFSDFIFFAPVAIIYFAKVTGSYALGMSVFSIAYVSAAGLEVPTGVISDMVGRRKTVILGSISAIICVVLYAVALSYNALIIAAFFHGLSRAFYSGNNDALLHDTLLQMKKEREYHTYLGKTSSMFQFALAGASLIGGFLASISLRLSIWLTLIPQFMALVTAFQFIEPSVSKKESTNIYAHLGVAMKHFKTNASLRLLTSISVIRFAVGESIFFLKSAFIETLWPMWALGVSRTFSHIGAALSFFYSGILIDRFGSKKILYMESLINRSVNFIALLFPSVISPVLLSVPSLSHGVNSVVVNALLQKQYTQHQRATMSSLTSFAGSIVFGLFAVIFGRLADVTTLANALIIANIVFLVLPLLYTKLKE